MADWSVQEARTEAARRGDKSSLPIQFDGFYLTAATIRITAPLLSTMRRMAKLLRTHTEQRM